MKKLNLYLAGLSGLIFLFPCHIMAQPDTSSLRESISRATSHKRNSVFYRVQILALKNPIDPEPLKVSGTDDKIYAIKGPDVTRYYMGEFRDLQSATEYKEQIVKNGFEDACVVAYKNDDRITIKESLALLGQGK